MPYLNAESDDALLVAAVIKKDKEAFRLLIHRYEKLVISVVFKLVRQREDVEDLCQDVFIKVYEKLPGFRFESKLSTWIATIAYNTGINFLRKRKLILLQDLQETSDTNFTLEDLEQSTFIDDSSKPDEQLLNQEFEGLISKSIDNLPLIQKTILQFFHHDEFSLQEISEITKMPVNTVKSHLFRARKQLKEAITKYQTT